MKVLKVNTFGITVQISLLVLLFTSACSQSKTNTANKTIEAPTMDIHAAIIANKADIVRQHIKAGTNINKKEPMSGATPLISAITFDKPEIAKMLIQANADLSVKNNDGSTALHVAAFFGRVKMVQMLMDAKANKNLKNNSGATPREIVLVEFAKMKPFYDMIAQQLKPMGFVLDMNELKKARPVIATMLQ